MLERTLHPIGAAPQVELARLFNEEALMWERDLTWDFEPTRRRLEAALREQTLEGLVATDARGVCAYATWSLHEGHGVIGSLFASERSRTLRLEDLLVRRILGRLSAYQPSVIDCQTLFSSEPLLVEPFSALGFATANRTYMTLERSSWQDVGTQPPGDLRPEPLTHRTLERVSLLVHRAHLETRNLDASSSFDTPESCERILRQIVEDHLCGPFDPLGSRAIERNGELLAISLLTWPLPGIAHISEVATAPAHRGLGLARSCLTQTLKDAFEEGAARSATLSVTASNQAALRLYGSLGFVPHREYRSHVLRNPSAIGGP